MFALFEETFIKEKLIKHYLNIAIRTANAVDKQLSFVETLEYWQ